MAYLVNPGGRTVAVHDEQAPELLKQGFKEANEEQIQTLTRERKLFIEQSSIDPDKNKVYFATVAGGSDGYGMSSRHIMRELNALGAGVTTINDDQKIGILYHNPYSVIRMTNPYKIIYTMFESDKIPDDWKEYLQHADKVLVPSKWCANVFSKAGIKTEVVPLGYNDDVFKYVKRENKRDQRKDFIFLHYNAFNIRKGFVEVLKAFTKEFAVDEPVKMIMKTNVKYLPFPLSEQEYPNIKVIKEDYEEDKLASLCTMADCFVYPSRGEGFGITPLEAMSTGMPAIVPNAHGISEYFNSDYMYEAKVKETCPALYSKYKGQDVGRMTVCDVDQLAKQMRWVYEHQDEAIEKGRLASEYVKQWTYKKTAIKLNSIIQDIEKLPLPEKKPSSILPLKEM